MYINNKLANAVRLALMFGAGSAAMVGNTAVAQEAEEESVERIEVTGSRIKRADMESSSPVSIITAEQMDLQGISSVQDALQLSTAQVGGLTAAVNNGGNGNATVDLRGLGANRTLVLLNGRRMVGSGTGATATVDLNTIPMAAVKRIEVLKDGASAVYGSDAIAGVVNIITSNDFEGMEVNGRMGKTFENDGDTKNLDATFGVANDKGNLVLSMGYFERGTVRQGDRHYSRCPIWERTGADGKPEQYCGGSANSIGTGAFIAQGPWIQFEPGGDGTTSPEGYHNFSNADRYNYAAASYLSTPVKRYNMAAMGRYEISEEVSFFAEAFHTNRQSVQQMAPQPINYTLGANGRNWLMDQNPEVYPFSGLYDFATPGETNMMYPLRRMTEMGPRIFQQEVNTTQLTAGFDGTLFEDYSWAFHYTYGRNSAMDISKNYINMDRVLRSVNENCEGVTVSGTHGNYSVSGNDPSAPCINYFGEGSMSQADADYIRYTDQGTSGTQMHHLAASISGDLFELPAGAMAFAVGIEHRDESAFNQPDAFSSAGLGSGNAVQPTAGGYRVNEAYIELAVPVLADLPAVQSLDLEVAGRYFDYSTFGSDSTYKVGLTWRLFDELMVRSVGSTAFRAPSVGELYGGQSTSYLNYSDPCNFVGGGNLGKYETACQKDVSAGLIPGDGSFEQQNTQVRALVGGNPNLGPETADTFTIGVVAEPLDGLSFTVDYFNIKLDNVISSVGVNTTYDKCYSAGANGGVGGSNAFCQNGNVMRDPTGNFDLTQAVSQNIASWDIKGYDFNARYNWDMAGLNWSVDWEATMMDSYKVIDLPGEPAKEYVGVALSGSGSIPKWKQNFVVGLGGDDWNVNYIFRYVDELVDNGVAFDGDDPADLSSPKAKEFMTHDINATYHINDMITVRGGILNFTDEQPPYYTNYDDANTDTTLYQYIGRNWYLGATLKF